MELMESAWLEMGLWDLFQQGRGANASFAIAMVIAVWVAARFSSVALEKGVNVVGKVILTLFALSVLMGGMSIVQSTEVVWTAHANALADLDAANGDLDLSAGSQVYVESGGSNSLRMIAGYVFYITGFLTATVQLWFDTSK